MLKKFTHLTIKKTLVPAFLVCHASTSSGQTLTPPKLTFEYGSVLDIQCPDMTNRYFQHEKRPGVDYHTQIMKEASSLTSELQKQWDEQGPELLSTLINIVGREFSRKELNVYSSACRTGGMSKPLVVGIKLHLKSVRKNPLPISDNITLTFHEFIHQYLSESFDYSRSEVLQEFKDAPSLFKNHVHLMALMNQTFKQSNRADLSEIYPQSLRGVYKEAWEIATSKEYQERLIKEVRTLKGNNKAYWFFDSFK